MIFNVLLLIIVKLHYIIGFLRFFTFIVFGTVDYSHYILYVSCFICLIVETNTQVSDV